MATGIKHSTAFLGPFLPCFRLPSLQRYHVGQIQPCHFVKRCAPLVRTTTCRRLSHSGKPEEPTKPDSVVTTDQRNGTLTQQDPSLSVSQQVTPLPPPQSPQPRHVQWLWEELQAIGIDAAKLSRAASEAAGGYSEDYGTSALRAFQSFVKKKTTTTDVDRAAARRTARQVEFLLKRHKSHQTEWIRHSDETTTQDALAKKQTFPLFVVLDNLRSALNVGSIYRTANACGCAGIVTCGITPHPWGAGHDKIAKSALGAQYGVATQHFITTAQALAFVRQAYPQALVVGLETTQSSVIYTQVQYPGSGNPSDGELLQGKQQAQGGNKNNVGDDTDKDKDEQEEKSESQDRLRLPPQYPHACTVFVVGNEVTGLDVEACIPFMDVLVELPVFGYKNSLNVAACVPVVLYEALRQWGALESNATNNNNDNTRNKDS